MNRPTSAISTPFRQNPIREQRIWWVVCVVYVALATIGYCFDMLQLTLLSFQVIYGAAVFIYGRHLIHSISLESERCDRDWADLRKHPAHLVAAIRLTSTSSLLLLCAKAVAFARCRNHGQCDIDLVVEGFSDAPQKKASRLATAAGLAVDLGLLGTSIGLIVLFQALSAAAGAGGQQFNEATISAVAGFGLAISTTIVGSATSVLLTGQHAISQSAIDRLFSQLKSLMTLLRTGGSSDAKSDEDEQ